MVNQKTLKQQLRESFTQETIDFAILPILKEWLTQKRWNSELRQELINELLEELNEPFSEKASSKNSGIATDMLGRPLDLSKPHKGFV